MQPGTPPRNPGGRAARHAGPYPRRDWCAVVGWFTSGARLGMLIKENPQRRNTRDPPNRAAPLLRPCAGPKPPPRLVRGCRLVHEWCAVGDVDQGKPPTKHHSRPAQPGGTPSAALRRTQTPAAAVSRPQQLHGCQAHPPDNSARPATPHKGANTEQPGLPPRIRRTVIAGRAPRLRPGRVRAVPARSRHSRRPSPTPAATRRGHRSASAHQAGSGWAP